MAPRIGLPGVLALLCFAAAAAAFQLPFQGLFSRRRLLQSPDSDWSSAVRPIVSSTINKWTEQYKQYDPKDVKKMSEIILRTLNTEFNFFRWAFWIFSDDDDGYMGPTQHYGFATIGPCDADIVRGCNFQGSMSGHEKTDHGKYSWILMWTASGTPRLADRLGAIKEATKVAEQCEAANTEFASELDKFAACILGKTQAAGVLVFHELINKNEDGGSFNPKDFLLFKVDLTKPGVPGYIQRTNVRMIPDIHWYSAVPIPAPEAAPTPPVEAPEVDTITPAEAPVEDDAGLPLIMPIAGDGCTSYYTERNCSLCVLLDQDIKRPTCLMCEPCYMLNADNTSCVYSKAHCHDFDGAAGPQDGSAPAPAPGDIGDGCNHHYHNGCGYCEIINFVPTCGWCQLHFSMDAEGSCQPKDGKTGDWLDFAPAPAPGPEEWPHFKPGEGCDPFYHNGCSYCKIVDAIPECDYCQTGYDKDENGTCISNGSSALDFDMDLGPIGAPMPLEGFYDDAYAPAPGPGRRRRHRRFKPGEGCDPFYHDGCMYCDISDDEVEIPICHLCQDGFSKIENGSCGYTGAPSPSIDLGAFGHLGALPPLGDDYEEASETAPSPYDYDEDNEAAPSPFDDDEYADDYAAFARGPVPHLALPPIGPAFEIPPDGGCTPHYMKGCMYCEYKMHEHFADCQYCQTDYVREDGGTCRFIGHHRHVFGPSADGPEFYDASDAPLPDDGNEASSVPPSDENQSGYHDASDAPLPDNVYDIPARETAPLAMSVPESGDGPSSSH